MPMSAKIHLKYNAGILLFLDVVYMWMHVVQCQSIKSNTLMPTSTEIEPVNGSDETVMMSLKLGLLFCNGTDRFVEIFFCKSTFTLAEKDYFDKRKSLFY